MFYIARSAFWEGEQHGQRQKTGRSATGLIRPDWRSHGGVAVVGTPGQSLEWAEEWQGPWWRASEATRRNLRSMQRREGY